VEIPSCPQFSAPLRFALVRNGQMPPANPVECGVDFVRTVVSTPCRAAICTQCWVWVLCLGWVTASRRGQPSTIGSTGSCCMRRLASTCSRISYATQSSPDSSKRLPVQAHGSSLKRAELSQLTPQLGALSD